MERERLWVYEKNIKKNAKCMLVVYLEHEIRLAAWLETWDWTWSEQVAKLIGQRRFEPKTNWLSQISIQLQASPGSLFFVAWLGDTLCGICISISINIIINKCIYLISYILLIYFFIYLHLLKYLLVNSFIFIYFICCIYPLQSFFLCGVLKNSVNARTYFKQKPQANNIV